jgi:hypothetical protein
LLRALKYFAVGAAIGWLLAFFAIWSAGAGHGTYYPAALFFGPFCVLWFSMWWLAGDWLITALLIATPLLYGFYSLLLLRGSVRGRPLRFAYGFLDSTG